MKWYVSRVTPVLCYRLLLKACSCAESRRRPMLTPLTYIHQITRHAILSTSRCFSSSAPSETLHAYLHQIGSTSPLEKKKRPRAFHLSEAFFFAAKRVSIIANNNKTRQPERQTNCPARAPQPSACVEEKQRAPCLGIKAHPALDSFEVASGQKRGSRREPE